MEVGHKNKANNGGNKASELNFFIVSDAAGEIVGDLSMIARNEDAGDHN